MAHKEQEDYFENLKVRFVKEIESANNIVEIGWLVYASSAVFSTVVCPARFEVNSVHGISDDELRQVWSNH